MAFAKWFSIDGSDWQYSAVRFGKPWNGWATPVVVREVFEKLARQEDPDSNHFELSFVVTSGVALWHDFSTGEILRIEPDISGHYDLSGLGWTFYEIEGD
ncbi:hypothetical protein SEA_DREAMTEAM1_90 [Mycobacterium phage DreamTeam1]|nr:hypothetical protein SEA_DREAMTEAM1_90 [Mycobacterium phage DreamTeam1]